MIILSIETSCDDTSIAIIDNGKIKSLVTHSQIEEHNKFGGIIPEVASRLHSENIFSMIKKCLVDAKLDFESIEAISVTKGPGLVNTLQIGLIVAKTLAQSLKKPLYTLNHLKAHIISPLIDKDEKLPNEFLSLIVSGGHTVLSRVTSKLEVLVLGETVDDAIGEAFDKVGKFLGLKYPGGPEIDSIYKENIKKINKEDIISFPIPRVEGWNFSYSGLKSSVISFRNKNPNISREILAISFQISAVKQILFKLQEVVKFNEYKNLFVGGGVAMNSLLKSELELFCKKNNMILSYPISKYTTDNAAMIAYLTHYSILDGLINPSKLDEDALPTMKIGD